MSAKVDLTGRKFGQLTVLAPGPTRHLGRQAKATWLCFCDCGNQIAVLADSLKSNRTQSCGCTRYLKTRERHLSKRASIVGQRFGKLVVTAAEEEGFVKVICDCGNTKTMVYTNVVSGNSKSCGCMAREKALSRFMDRVGQRYNRLTVIELVDRELKLWKCVCDCGAMVVVSGSDLGSGSVKSCGCLRSELIRAHHARKRLDAQLASQFGTPEEFAARLGRARQD